jgi:preprotein translocase subunit SecG
MMMNNILLLDSIGSANKILSQSSAKHSITNIWMWIAIIEFVIIVLYLILSKYKKTPEQLAKKRLKEESKNDNIDFTNIINSSFNAKSLYDELKVKCHPDRFTDDEKNRIANSLFQEISKNKTNYEKMIKLKEEAKQKLNINF